MDGNNKVDRRPGRQRDQEARREGFPEQVIHRQPDDPTFLVQAREASGTELESQAGCLRPLDTPVGRPYRRARGGY